MWKIVLTLSSELLVWANASDEPEWRNAITGIAACCARRERPHSRRAAECGEVRKWNDTTPRASCPNRAALGAGGRTPDTGCNGAPPHDSGLISRDLFSARPLHFLSDLRDDVDARGVL